jgi:uncharacterized protein
MLRVVVDTNLWIRVLLRGPKSFPLLEAWRDHRFEIAISEPLLDELDEVWQRPRLRRHIDPEDAMGLLDQLRLRGLLVVLRTTPPHCRDPKDHPVLATAIDGRAHAIVSGDDDLRADDELRSEMADLGVEIWGINGLLERIGSKARPEP